MYCIFFALQSCSQMDFLFISDGRLGRDRFVSPFQNCVLAKNPQPLTFTFLLYIIHSLGGQRSTETREREKRGKGRGDESIGSRCALIVVLLELMDECCYQKARNVCLLTTILIFYEQSRKIMESFLQKIQIGFYDCFCKESQIF